MKHGRLFLKKKIAETAPFIRSHSSQPLTQTKILFCPWLSQSPTHHTTITTPQSELAHQLLWGSGLAEPGGGRGGSQHSTNTHTGFQG